MAGWRQVLSSTDTVARVRHAHPGALRTEMPHVIPGALAHPGYEKSPHCGLLASSDSRRIRSSSRNRSPGLAIGETRGLFGGRCRTSSRVRLRTRATKNPHIAGFFASSDSRRIQNTPRIRSPGAPRAPGALRRDMPRFIPGVLCTPGLRKTHTLRAFFASSNSRWIRGTSRNRSPGAPRAPGALRREMPRVIPGVLCTPKLRKTPALRAFFASSNSRRIRSSSRNRSPGAPRAPGALRRETPHVIPGALAHPGYGRRVADQAIFSRPPM